MATSSLREFGRRPCNILCLGAHADDIEIGCGGTLLKLLEQHEQVSCRWIVFSADAERERECRTGAERFLRRAVHPQVDVLHFRDGFMPFEGTAIKEHFERLKDEAPPDLIFTHYLRDRHQDHRLLSELTWNTFRHHLILEYEVPKYDGDFGQPNVFVELSDEQGRRKIEYLMQCYETQRRKRWFAEETFRAVLRLRGMEAAASTGWAEGFYGRKLLW